MHNRSSFLVLAAILLFSGSALAMSFLPFRGRLNVYSDGDISRDYTTCGKTCPEGEHCELYNVQCVRAPCHPVKKCVKTSGVTCANVKCAGRCFMHQTCDSSGCKDVPMCTARGEADMFAKDDMTTDQGYNENQGSKVEYRDEASKDDGWGKMFGGFQGSFGWQGSGNGYVDGDSSSSANSESDGSNSNYGNWGADSSNSGNWDGSNSANVYADSSISADSDYSGSDNSYVDGYEGDSQY